MKLFFWVVAASELRVGIFFPKIVVSKKRCLNEERRRKLRGTEFNKVSVRVFEALTSTRFLVPNREPAGIELRQRCWLIEVNNGMEDGCGQQICRLGRSPQTEDD